MSQLIYPSLWKGQTGTGTSPLIGPLKGRVLTLQATVAGTGAVSATFAVDGTNDPLDANAWTQLGTITASGTGTGVNAVSVADTAFMWFRLRLTAISGTGASGNASLSKA